MTRWVYNTSEGRAEIVASPRGASLSSLMAMRLNGMVRRTRQPKQLQTGRAPGRHSVIRQRLAFLKRSAAGTASAS